MKRVAGLLLALSVALGSASGPCPALRPVNSSTCPPDLDLLDPCDTYGLRDGDLCEGDGECGTSKYLDNCVTDDTRADVYEVVNGTQSIAAGECPELLNITSKDCPGREDLLDLRSCDAGHAIGDFCEGDGECGTDRDLNNCSVGDMHADVYEVVGFAPSPQPTQEPPSPPRGCPASKYVLVPVAKDNCPDSAVKKSCNTTTLRAGDKCEAHGECGTDPHLNNCEYDSGDVWQDIYEVCKTKFDKDVRGITKIFFDEECVATLSSSKFDGCPVKVLSDLVEEFLGGFRMESFLFSVLSLLGSISLLQLGGVIRPSTTFGLVLWTLCFLGFLLEAVATLLGIIMVVIAYVLMRSEFRECMQPFTHLALLMDYTAPPSFLFVPPVLFRIVLLFVTLCGLAEFIFVFRACARVEERKFELAKQNAASDAKHLKPELVVRIVYCWRSLRFLWAFLGQSNNCCAWCMYLLPLLGVVFCLWWMVLPFTFSFFLIIGVWPALALTFLLPCLFFYGIEKLSKHNCVGDFWKEQIHAVFWWSAVFLKVFRYWVTGAPCIYRYRRCKNKSTELRLGLSGEYVSGDGIPLAGLRVRGIRGSPPDSWSESSLDSSEAVEEPLYGTLDTPFVNVVFVLFVLITLSPMFVYGSWLICYAFSPRYNTDDIMHVVNVIYAYTFQIFNGFLPAMRGLDFSLDPRSLRNVQAAVGYLADLVNINAFSAQHYLDGARGMDALSLLISLCRSGVAFIAKLMAFLKLYGVEKTIEFYVLLGGGAVYHRTFKQLAADPGFFGTNAVDVEWFRGRDAAEKEEEAAQKERNERGFGAYEAPISPKSPEP